MAAKGEQEGEDEVADVAGPSEVPTSSISIDSSLPLDQMRHEIVDLCKDLFSKWSKLDETRFSIEKVSGGITNLLLKVSIREDEETACLTVRLYGPNTDVIINRERELKAINYLSAAGFGAKLLGIFKNGMVQSFIKARTLSPEDMSKPHLVAKIARELHRFHQVAIPGSREPQLWNDITKFLDKAVFLTFTDETKQTTYDSISFEEIRGEIATLKEITSRLNAPVAFCHNDLLSGNLMLSEDEEKLYLIDFEYGSYNYRGYDIGNHFNEYAGFECDYNLYPSKDMQYIFFRHYLQADKTTVHEQISEEDLESLYVETSVFMLASHIYWAIWALIQASASPIDFDYLGYFFLRYDQYKKQRDACFSLAHAFLSASRSPR
ncbi:protein kinase superfamily protein isoform X2 [Wolffia australiana]